MARSAQQLLECDPPSKRPLLHVTFLESRLRFTQGGSDEDDIGDYRISVVSLVNDDTSKQHLLWLAAAVGDVRTTYVRFVGDDCVEQFERRLNEREVDFSNTVLILPLRPTSSPADAQAVIEATRQVDALHTLTVVSEDTKAWRQLVGVTGFVRAAEGCAVSTGANLGLCMATLASPLLMSCLDPVEIETALGTAAEPSMLIDALWIEAEQRLVFLTADGAKLVARSREVVVFLFAATLPPASAALEAIRAVGKPSLSLPMQIATTTLRGTQSDAAAIPVKLLCIV